MKIKITADRMIDLSDSELAELDISTISCFVNMGGESYGDLEDVFPEDVFVHFEKTKEVARTAAKSPDHYADFFRPFVEDGCAVIHFAASSGISAICDNSKIAAQRFENVYVVDSLTLSNGIALLAKYAISLIEQGETDVKKIHELCLKQREKVRGGFIIETLDCLYRGGRCSSLQYYGANLLRIRPVIGMDETGHMKIRDKYHGNYKRAVAKFIANMFKKNPNPDLKQLYMLHFFKDKKIEEFLVQTVSEYAQFENIYFSASSCNCAIHSGRNTVGMFFVVND